MQLKDDTASSDPEMDAMALVAREPDAAFSCLFYGRIVEENHRVSLHGTDEIRFFARLRRLWVATLLSGIPSLFMGPGRSRFGFGDEFAIDPRSPSATL